MSDLVAGAWREGLDSTSRTAIEGFEHRRTAGFRLIGSEIEQAKLIDLLDSYDTLVEELLLTAPAAAPSVVESFYDEIVDDLAKIEPAFPSPDKPVDEDEKWEKFLADGEDFHEYEMQAAEDIPELQEIVDPQPPEPIKPPRVGKAKSRIKKA